MFDLESPAESLYYGALRGIPARGPCYTLIRHLRGQDKDQAARLRRTLCGCPAFIPPKYFYDKRGGRLFGNICKLPEYYVTRTEAGIFARHSAQIAAILGVARQFVDLGAGDCKKAEFWVPHLRPSRYVAVDIEEEGLCSALDAFAHKYPSTRCSGIVTDFSNSLDIAEDLVDMPSTFFYPGSSIGNFTPEDAVRFLSEIRGHCRPGDNLLIGVDTKKDVARLQAAYDDSAGVTAAFNLNALRNVNALLGSDFDPGAFRHVALYNSQHGRIEMHLEAKTKQRVSLGTGLQRLFKAGERIHTENSYKYSPEEFRLLLFSAGFEKVRVWTDDAGDFAVYTAAPM